eukprot:813868-Rhodomonas_salina.2
MLHVGVGQRALAARASAPAIDSLCNTACALITPGRGRTALSSGSVAGLAQQHSGAKHKSGRREPHQRADSDA